MIPVHFRKQGRRPSRALLLLVSLGVLSVLLVACGDTTPSAGSPPATPTPSLPTGLLTPGVLTVGSDTNYPPQEYLDSTTHTAAGFDIDLITAIAKQMGLRATIVPAPFATLLNDLAARRFDVAISAVTITPERQKQVDFIPYLSAGESLLVQQGNPKHITSTDELCGFSVGVQDGSVEQGVLQSSSDNCQEQDRPAITLVALADQTAVVQLLATGRVVATYQDSPVTDYYAKQSPDQFEVGGSVVFPAPEGIAVRKNDAALFRAIQTAYQQVKAAGTYQQLLLKWGLTNEALTAAARRLPDAWCRSLPCSSYMSSPLESKT